MPSRTAGIFLLLSRNNEDLQSAGRTIRDKCEKYLYRKAVCMSTGIRRGSVGNCTWSIDKYWTLTIEAVKGTDGVLDDYNLRGWPWEEYVKKIRKVFIKDGVAANTNMGFMFSGMKNCRVFDIAALDTGNAQMMDSLFYDCSNLTDLTPVAGWNVGSVTDMAFMFSGCTELSDLTPLAKWDVSHVRNTEGIFEACSGITDLSPLIKWDVSNVKVMAGLFAGCSGVTDLSPLAKWAVNNVEDMESMFVNCKAVTDISTKYNDGTVTTFTPAEDVNVIQLALVATSIEMNMTSGVYHKELVETGNAHRPCMEHALGVSRPAALVMRRDEALRLRCIIHR